MKKLFIGLCLISITGVYAELKMPTIYGKINKEFRYVKHDWTKSAGKVPFASNPTMVDVDNSESRLGAKSSYDLGSDHNATYKLELGLNTSVENDSSGRIRIRVAEVTFGGFWGSIIAGQTFGALELDGISLDPLGGTGLSLLGADQSGDMANGASTIGYMYRGTADLIGYKSPKIMGLQLYTTIDKANNHDMSPEVGTPGVPGSDTPNKPTYWQTALSWDHEMGDASFGFKGGYRKVSGILSNSEHTLQGGLYFSMMDFTLTGMYSLEKAENTSIIVAGNNVDVLSQCTKFTEEENKRMMLTGKYVFLEDNTIAITYGKAQYDTGITKTTTDKDETTQFAVGLFRKVHKNITVRAQYGATKRKYDDALEDNDFGNKINTFALGTQLTF